MKQPNFPKWYPVDVDDEIDLGGDESPYGDPQLEVMAVIKARLKTSGAKIIDVAGGDGRYALPLAAEGHDVTVLDIDPRALEAVERKALKLPDGAGQITTVQADVISDEDMRQFAMKEFDASLNTAFLYLAPPEIAKGIFRRSSSALRVGGLAVVQFSTNIERQSLDGASLIGAEEHLYREDEGKRVLTEMYSDAGFKNLELESFVIHQEEPYLLHADVLVASGTKVRK